MNKKNHISNYLSPRFVHFHELNILESTVALKNSEIKDVNSTKTIEKAYDKYLQINYRWRYLYMQKSFDKNSFFTTNNIEKEGILVNEISYNDDSPSIKVNKKIAIANIKLLDSDIDKVITGSPKTLTEKRKKLFKLINEAVYEKCDMLVLPELAIPYEWLALLAYQSRKHNLGIVTGLEYFVDDSSKNAYNLVATILPTNKKNYLAAIVKLRLKNLYAPFELKNLSGHSLLIPKEKDTYDLFHWKKSYFSVYNCFELNDIYHRSLFKSKVDFLVAVEWNKDTNHFSDIIGSWSRDLHCYLIQVNTSQYGDSRIMQPSKSETKNLISVKGGQNAVALVDEINIEKMRNFQCLEYNLQEEDKNFKSTPPNFDKENVKKRIKNKTFLFNEKSHLKIDIELKFSL